MSAKTGLCLTCSDNLKDLFVKHNLGAIVLEMLEYWRGYILALNLGYVLSVWSGLSEFVHQSLEDAAVDIFPSSAVLAALFLKYELLHYKTCLSGFRLGPTQTRLINHRRRLEV